MGHNFYRRAGRLSACALLSLSLLALSCTLEPPPKKVTQKSALVEGAGVTLTLRSGDGVPRGRVRPPGLELAPENTDSLVLSALALVIEDGLSGAVLDERSMKADVASFSEGETGVTLEKRFPGSVLSLRQQVSGQREGVFISSWLSTRDDTLHSVSVTYLVPLTRGCRFWTASGQEPLDLEGGTSFEYTCGPAGEAVERTAVPLAVFWRPGGPGLAVAAPLESRSVRVTFSADLEGRPLGLAASGGGEDWLSVRFDLLGVRPGQELQTGIWLYGVDPDWRPALGAYAERYREYFESRAGAGRRDGALSLIDPPDVRGANYNSLRTQEITLAEIVWNWRRPGEWVLPQALRFDDFAWDCTLGGGRYSQVTVQKVRAALDGLAQAEVRSVVQGAFSQVCDREIALGQWREDIARDESGAELDGGGGELFMHAAAEGPWGRNLLEQQKKLMDLYPLAGGYYFDGWESVGLDLAHDDSLSAVGNRPAWYLGFNQTGLGAQLIDRVHEERKLVLAAAPPHAALGRGVDILTVDPARPEDIPAAAFLGLFRPLVARPAPGGPYGAPGAVEFALQGELLWGVLPSHEQLAVDPTLDKAYRPLFSNLRGRQWVLEAGALELSHGVSGQIYRVPAPERGGERDLVVVLTRPGVRLSDQSLRRGVTVRLRTTDSRTVLRASWQAAGVSWPVPLRTSLEGDETLVVEVPPFGPAGVLRLAQH
ncbi:hypothetical protein LLH00_11910 [bacterium]|nr:hypothetical protein [bacterium]